MLSLSKRLALIAGLVPDNSKVCDIGTDHGYLPISLIKSKKAVSVIASDIREKPLSSARKNIKEANITDIDLRLCDGLSGIQDGEADTVIIAGMGGEVISGILEKSSWIKSPEITLILQPMTSSEELRRWLLSNGFIIDTEPTVAENGKLYSVIKSHYTGKNTIASEAYYYIGEINPKTETDILYIKKQLKRCLSCSKSLENIESKRSEYLGYKSVANEIMKILEDNNGI